MQGGGLLPFFRMAYVTIGQTKTVVRHPLQNNAPVWVERGTAKAIEVQMYVLGTFLHKEQTPASVTHALTSELQQKTCELRFETRK